MPRLSRAVFAGVPHHITQRGNRRDDVFFTDEDRLVYLEWLQSYCQEHDVDVLAYCLMTNHIHLVFSSSYRRWSSASFEAIAYALCSADQPSKRLEGAFVAGAFLFFAA